MRRDPKLFEFVCLCVERKRGREGERERERETYAQLVCSSLVKVLME